MVVCAALLFVPVAIKSRTNKETPVRSAFRALSSGRVSVKVSGEVLHPGIYEVPANSLAAGVIKMADPLQPMKRYNTDSSAARPLLNGAAVWLLKQPGGQLLLTVGEMSVPERLVLGVPLDITTMNEADFERLPGIGPALARRISVYRQKNGGMLRVEDLAAVEGIGEKKYRTILGCFQHNENID
jgi:competence protein ComEA